MTKTITIPLSSETCNNIKNNLVLSGWFAMPIFCWAMFGLTIGHAIYYNVFDWHFPASLFTGVFGFLTTMFLGMELKSRGKWIEFKCNCDEDKVEL